MNRFLKYLKVELKFWKLLIVGVFFYAISTLDLELYTNASTMDYMIYEINDSHNIIFYWTFCIIFLFLEVRRLSIKRILAGSFLIILVYILTINLSYAFRYGYISYESQFYNPFMVLFISITLLLLRLIFLIETILLVNSASDISLGFLGPFGVSIFDLWFYEVFDIMKPFCITPLEHSRYFYTEAVAPTSEISTRMSFWFSYLYWALLITVFALVLIKFRGQMRYEKSV